ncbi:class I SAM-dependent methyltransferase [Myxococcus sp. MISCRS1]|jgi:SAM-dependent methyltransferase|uniref:class I SAM-dependent DNA methyltransferase n=1 Tax=Myxococcus TaxID=32 RepID=UPI001CBEB6EE|nr:MULTISPECIES: class I SAM-dependent methyltransferase [unclassified Myxococcus]MBZ4395488.1 class I SAM-dependent methyltransferase [Myxococcus sp. AS-1-15]MBZ4411951.1 class I SAM-dependent methyltransferase [Myxococcus sp. XM-1-1-1]MCY0999158.1 class I SAM-dependent methyltransferase [Myxococcus sp. MISCRS1]BDT30836.1 methyltransferase domain-containing protein [Myxococcus sp. MH1]
MSRGSPQEEAVRAIYGEIASAYEALFPVLGRYEDRVERFLTDAVSPGCRVLDVGCGPGLHTKGLEPSVHVVGTDLSPQMLELARQARPSGEWYAHDYYQPFPAEWGRFQVALALGCLDFCDDLRRVLRHIADMLAPGGRLLFTALERRPGHEGHEAPTREVRTAGPAVTLHLYSFEEASRAVTDAGLEPRAYVHAPGWVQLAEERTLWFGWWEVERR